MIKQKQIDQKFFDKFCNVPALWWQTRKKFIKIRQTENFIVELTNCHTHSLSVCCFVGWWINFNANSLFKRDLNEFVLFSAAVSELNLAARTELSSVMSSSLVTLVVLSLTFHRLGCRWVCCCFLGKSMLNLNVYQNPIKLKISWKCKR